MERITAEEYRRLKGKPKRNKYGAKRTEYRGVRYDSKAEARFAMTLDCDKIAAPIWFRQVPVQLDALSYRVDFLVIRNWGAVDAYDVKGVETQRFRDIKKLWARHGPCPLIVVEWTGRVFRERERIEPKKG